MKRLVTTSNWLYDSTGKPLGREVVEIEAFTEQELKQNGNQCSECGGFGGVHREYFVKTGQDGFGSVDGYYRRCSAELRQKVG